MTIEDQPPPIPNDSTPIVDLVMEDLAERKRIGIERYGVALQAHNGRDMLVDAYQEAMDLVIYLRGEIEDRSIAGTVHDPKGCVHGGEPHIGYTCAR